MKKRIAKAVLFWYRNASKGGKIMTKITKPEMETIVNYNAGEQTATVYTREVNTMPNNEKWSKCRLERERSVKNNGV